MWQNYVAVTGISLSADNEYGVIRAAITPVNATTQKVAWSVQSLDHTQYAIAESTDTTCRVGWGKNNAVYKGDRCILSATIDGITKTVTCTQIGSSVNDYGHTPRFSYAFN